MLSQSLKEEKQEDIIGFHVLSDGSFLKVHNNSQVEIRKGDTTTFIKIEEVGSHLSDVNTQIIELPDQRIALAYCMGWRAHNPSTLVILDLANGICLASKAVNDIKSLSALAGGSFLLNSDTLCFYQDHYLVTTKADQFIDFMKGFKFFEYALDDARFLSLPDSSGFVYVDKHHQSGIKVLNHLFKERAQWQMGPETRASTVPSSIQQFAFISADKFACMTRSFDKLKDKYSYYLHVFNTDLVSSYERTLHHIKPQQFFALHQDHVAVVGEQEGKDDHKIFVKIFDAKGKKVKKIIIDKDIENNYIAVTPSGQLVTCSKTGEITLHHIFTLTEKLKKETESVLTGSNMPKELTSIVTDYAGFFCGNSQMPKETFGKVDYPDECPNLFSKLKAKF